MRESWRRQRRSIRLVGWDYAGDGAYFVTICTYQRACLFGAVIDGEMRLNAAGEGVAACWAALPAHFPQVTLDAWVVMPNHVHGILFIDDSMPAEIGDDLESAAGARHPAGRLRTALPVRGNPTYGEVSQAENDSRMDGAGRRHGPGNPRVGARHALPEAHNDANDDPLRQFGVPVAGDLATVIRSFKSAATKAVNEVRGTEGPGVWHRNYYEKIIRNEQMLNAIRQYIAANPAQWAGDEFYVDAGRLR